MKKGIVFLNIYIKIIAVVFFLLAILIFFIFIESQESQARNEIREARQEFLAKSSLRLLPDMSVSEDKNFQDLAFSYYTLRMKEERTREETENMLTYQERLLRSLNLFKEYSYVSEVEIALIEGTREYFPLRTSRSRNYQEGFSLPIPSSSSQQKFIVYRFEYPGFNFLQRTLLSLVSGGTL